MSDTTTKDAGRAGVLVTIRELPPAARFLLLGVFINQFGAFLQAFLVLYLVHRGFSDHLAGYALGAYGAGAVVGLLFGGGLTDRLGPRRTIIAGMLSAAVLVVTVSFLSSYPVILVVVAVAGAMAQSYRPASATMLAEMVPQARQVMGFALNRIALNLGTVAGPLTAAWMITYSWNLIFWVDGITSVLYAAIAVFLLPRVGPVRAEPGDAGEAAEPGEASPAPATRYSYFRILGDGLFVLYLFAMLTNALIHIQSAAVLPLSLTDRGYSTLVYSSVYAVSAGIVITCELLVTKVVQHWRAWVAGSVGLLLLGAGLFGWGLHYGVAVLLGATVVGVIGQIIGGPTIFAWPAKVAPAAARGRYLGLAHAMFGAGQALGPVLGVLLYARIGDRFWTVCGVVGVVSAAAAAIGMRERSKAPVAEQAADEAAADLLAAESTATLAPDSTSVASVGEPAAEAVDAPAAQAGVATAERSGA